MTMTHDGQDGWQIHNDTLQPIRPIAYIAYIAYTPAVSRVWLKLLGTSQPLEDTNGQWQ